MLRRLRRFTPVLIVIGLSAILLPSFAFAHDGHDDATQSQAITITPASTDVSVDPGKSTSKSITVINEGDESFNITLSRSPYHVLTDSYDPQFTQIPGTVDASEWVKLSQLTGTVEGKEQLAITYTIDVPANTAPGGYYAVIFAETSTSNASTGVVSHNKVGNILYITVNGAIKTAGNFAGGALPALHFMGPIALDSKISNSGGVHFKSTVVYYVTDIQGNEVYRSSTEKYVLPQTERQFNSSWTPQSPLNIFTVHRSATVAGELKTLPDEKIIIVNPFLLAMVAFFIGVLIAISVQRSRQRRQQKEK